MASCNDCLHFEICDYYEEEELLFDSEAEECKHFKDRSRFVELPCKVGDTLYEICLRKKGSKWKPVIIERTVQRIEVGSSGSVIIRCGRTITLFSFDFGKIVFLSREEAEQALNDSEIPKN